MRYLFDNYCLDTQHYELHQAGVPIPLPPKVFQILAYLLAQGDRIEPVFDDAPITLDVNVRRLSSWGRSAPGDSSARCCHTARNSPAGTHRTD